MSRRTFQTFLAISLISLFSFSLSANATPLTAAARKKEIARKINVLGNIGFGVHVHKATGASAEEMVRDLAVLDGSINDSTDFLVGATSKDFDFGDMSKWGTTDLASAQDLFASGDGSEEDAIKEKRRATLGKTILGELSRLGRVSFGFTSGSSSYCGVSFMGLLIVDEENGLIYELPLTSSGPC
jgi:hypothetical protein